LDVKNTNDGLAQDALQLYPYGNSGRQRVNRGQMNNVRVKTGNLATDLQCPILCLMITKQVVTIQPGSAMSFEMTPHTADLCLDEITPPARSPSLQTMIAFRYLTAT